MRGGGVDHAADGELGEAAARGGAREGVQAMDVAAEDDGAFAAEEVEEFIALRAVLFRGELMPRGAGAVRTKGGWTMAKKCSAVRRAAAGSAGVKARVSNATQPVGERKEAGRGGRISVSGTQTRAGKPLPRGAGLPAREVAAVAQKQRGAQRQRRWRGQIASDSMVRAPGEAASVAARRVWAMRAAGTMR